MSAPTPAAPEAKPPQAPAPAPAGMVNVTIDGKLMQVKAGITIIEAMDKHQVDVPRYCYHPGLSIAGNCRICQVEVEKMPRTVIACNTRVAEGMVIHSKSAKAQESQKIVLEFLLANHPLDCPVCDQSGECKLQDYYMQYGIYDPHFNENKVKKTKKAFSIGPTILLDQERCVLCSRCVRFTDEVTKTHEFGIFNRGDHAEVDVQPGRQLDNKYSGNVADICPVGALTDKDFRFKMRVWYLGKQKSVCPGCSRGCNTTVEYEKTRPYHLKEERVMRLKPRENEAVNKWWMCDEGRYGYKDIDFGRLKQVLRRSDGALVESYWDEALALGAQAIRSGRWALITSAQHPNEELYLQKKLFVDHLKWSLYGFESPHETGYEDGFLMKKDKTPNGAGARQILKGATSVQAILDKARAGELDGLFVSTHDLSAFGPDVLRQIRAKVKTIVYCGPSQKAADAVDADFRMPAAVYAEKDGTFVNFEGRVQRFWKALEPIGASRPSRVILTALLQAAGAKAVEMTPQQIFDELAKENEAFRGLSYQALGDQGKVWSAKS